MAVFSLFTTTFNHSHSYTPLNFFTSLQNFSGDLLSNLKAKGRINRICCRKIRVVSSHSNPKILKQNRKSRYGQPVSPYDSEEDDDDDSGGDVDDVDDEFTDDEFADIKISEADRQRLKMQNSTKMKQGISNSSGINQRFEVDL
ncbi:transcription termination factor MTERF9 [Forsythia ovata]|uniref:Transcription termination factor MTERF9 n=1 Tax=Forsythia ovata TaxID=205694 RepID=A0ABD1U7Q4_9LAMI